MKNGGLVLQHLMMAGACEPIITPRGQRPHKTFACFRGPHHRVDDSPTVVKEKGLKKGIEVKLACDPEGPVYTVAKIKGGQVYLRGYRGMSKSFHPRALTVVK